MNKIILICLFLLAAPFVAAAAPFPLPGCFVEGIIVNVTFEPAHNHSCVANPPCPTDVISTYLDRYILKVNISEVSYENGSAYVSCAESYKIGFVKEFYLNLATVSGNDSFDKGDILEIELASSYPQINSYRFLNQEVSCKHEGEMCGGIAGFVCCSGLTCELEGDYPDAAGACVKSTQQEICENKCGDGICDEYVCQEAGCPCAENVEICPRDCETGNEWFQYWKILLGIVAVVVFVFIGWKIAKLVFWILLGLVILSGILYLWFF